MNGERQYRYSHTGVRASFRNNIRRVILTPARHSGCPPRPCKFFGRENAAAAAVLRARARDRANADQGRAAARQHNHSPGAPASAQDGNIPGSTGALCFAAPRSRFFGLQRAPGARAGAYHPAAPRTEQNRGKKNGGRHHSNAGNPACLSVCVRDGISNSQSLAALGASAAKNRAPRRRGHAGAEPVHAFALDAAGLICSFHSRILLEENRNEIHYPLSLSASRNYPAAGTAVSSFPVCRRSGAPPKIVNRSAVATPVFLLQ